MRVGLLLCLALSLAAARAEQIVLTNGTSRCEVDTVGGRVLSYRVGGEELLWQGNATTRESVTPFGGNMQGWRKDPTNNPPRIQIRFYKYDDGRFVDISER